MRILLAPEGFPAIPLANTLTAFKILIRFDLCDTCQLVREMGIKEKNKNLQM